MDPVTSLGRIAHIDEIERWPALPTEAPLPMPRQSLRDAPEVMTRPATAPNTTATRRAFVLMITAGLTGLAGYEMYRVLEIGGLTFLEGVMLALFVPLCLWVAFSFATAFAGFVAGAFTAHSGINIDSSAPLPRITSQNALLVPTYNEAPQLVMARIEAIYRSTQDTGQLEQFDFFILSDTNDPDIWIAEERAFLDLRERTSGHGRIFYRHRRHNEERKAGNIADWVRRFGGAYQHMIVLDADSLMTGDAIVRLAHAMEQNPSVGLIQTLPVVINGETLFARNHQFAGRVYGPLIARGLAWWHGAEGNYWGHNAIIRIRAFAQAAGLPQLRGRKPFGGHVLSHDFVEAALMRRAGWAIHMVPGLSGSYEEMPPSLTEYAVRDRRWCQGNLQHAAIVPTRGLHWISRLHLVTGIASYVTAPLWLTFLLTGLLLSLQAQFIRPDYFPPGFSLFPRWPAQDPVRAAWVFAGTMGLLLAPKLLGYLAILMQPALRRGCGGALRALASVILETLVSGLLAPVLMLIQSAGVFGILAGRDVGWKTQRREVEAPQSSDVLRRYGSYSLAGVLLAVAAYHVSVPFFFWLMPVTLGLALAVPLAAITSRSAIGKSLRRLGLLLIPEERTPPDILTRTNALEAGAANPEPVEAVRTLRRDPALLDAHRRMLAARPHPRGQIDADLILGVAKIEATETLEDTLGLFTPREKVAVLSDPFALDLLMAKPQMHP